MPLPHSFSQTAGVRLNLAECYAKLDKTASAWSKADEALDLAERTGDAAAAGLARNQMAALKPKLSYLTIVVAKETAAKGLEVTLDGEKIPDAVWGTAFPVDPGEHGIAATAPQHKPWSTKVAVTGEGMRSSLSVPELGLLEESTPAPPVLAPVPPGGTQAGQASDHGSPGAGRSGALFHTLALVSGGLGIVGLGVGTVFGIRRQLQEVSIPAASGPRGLHRRGVRDDPAQDAVKTANASTVSFVVGGVLTAAGIVLWITAPGQEAEGRAVAVVPIVGPRGMGAGLSGSF